jgi:hypothetical protein
MHSASELAEWWERKTKESDKFLLEFVDAYPNLWVIGAVGQTAMEFAGVMVFDVFRFGEGAAESYETGKIGPLVQDVFRGMAIAGGVGKVAQVGRVAAGRTLGLYANVAGGTCAPIAVGNALRRTGQFLFLSLEEIAAAHGVSLDLIRAEGASMAESIAALRKLGVSFDILKAGSWQNVVARLSQGKGVMMLRIIGSEGGANHRIIIQKMGGVVKILDRYGEFADLEALSIHYASVLKGGKFIVDPAADAVFLKNVLSMLVKGIPTLMIEANAIAHLAQGTTVQELDRKFEEFKSGRPRAIHLTTLPKVTVAPGDTLSGLALKHYSSVEYWPLIWDANRETVGENPNRIRPGIKLTIPALSDFSVPEKQNARHRYLTWRNPH